MAVRIRLSLLLVLALVGSFFLLHQAISTVPPPSLPAPVLPSKLEYQPQWKEVALTLLDKIRNGTPLSETENGVLAAIYAKLQGGDAASNQVLVEELITLIEMIWDLNDQLLKDDGEQRGDRLEPPGGS